MIVRIHTIDGREFTEQLDYPKGDPRNPLTDKEVEEKFEALAGPVMSREARRRAMDAIWNLEKQASVTELMQLFRDDRAVSEAALIMPQTIVEKIAQSHMTEGPSRPAARRRLRYPSGPSMS